MIRIERERGALRHRSEHAHHIKVPVGQFAIIQRIGITLNSRHREFERIDDGLP